MREFTDQRMRAIALRLDKELGINGILLDGPFPDSDRQLVALINDDNQYRISVMPDIDEPALYELVLFHDTDLDKRDVLHDKLTADMVVAIVKVISKLP